MFSAGLLTIPLGVKGLYAEILLMTQDLFLEQSNLGFYVRYSFVCSSYEEYCKTAVQNQRECPGFLS